MFLEVAEVAETVKLLVLEGQISRLETVLETANDVYSSASPSAATTFY